MNARLPSLPRGNIVIAIAALALVVGCGDSEKDVGASTAGDRSEVAAQPSDKRTESTADKAGPTPVGGAKGPVLQGDVKQARAGAQAVGEVYGDLGTAIADGIAEDAVPVADTLATADDADSLTGICTLMSSSAQRQTIVYAERSAGLSGVDWTCEKAMALLLRRTDSRGGAGRVARATVIGVNAEGDRATATVRFGGKRGRVSTLPLVKEDGRWKLGTAPGAGG